MRADAFDERIGVERLHDYVVFADRIVEHLVRVRLAGYDDERDVLGRGVMPHLVEHPAPGHVGHHQIQQDEIGLAKLGLSQSLESVPGLHDLVAMLLENELLKLANRLFVFNDQHTLRHNYKNLSTRSAKLPIPTRNGDFKAADGNCIGRVPDPGGTCSQGRDRVDQSHNPRTGSAGARRPNTASVILTTRTLASTSCTRTIAAPATTLIPTRASVPSSR